MPLGQNAFSNSLIHALQRRTTLCTSLCSKTEMDSHTKCFTSYISAFPLEPRFRVQSVQFTHLGQDTPQEELEESLFFEDELEELEEVEEEFESESDEEGD